MTPEQFTYWLQGFVELNDGKQPDDAQWKMIQEHLATVFFKITPALVQPLVQPIIAPFKPIIDPIWEVPTIICGPNDEGATITQTGCGTPPVYCKSTTFDISTFNDSESFC